MQSSFPIEICILVKQLLKLMLRISMLFGEMQVMDWILSVGLKKVQEILKVVLVQNVQQLRHFAFNILTFEFMLVNEQIRNHT